MPSAHGTAALSDETNSDLLLIPAVSSLYEKIVDRSLMIKRVNITCNNAMPEENHQYNLFVAHRKWNGIEKFKKLSCA